jgi:hypothetical protein
VDLGNPEKNVREKHPFSTNNLQKNLTNNLLENIILQPRPTRAKRNNNEDDDDEKFIGRPT